MVIYNSATKELSGGALAGLGTEPERKDASIPLK